MPGSEAYRRFQDTGQFASLDGLRAIAIIAVIWHHAGGDQFVSNTLASQGFHGVSLFFALSGFLITTLLVRESDRDGTIALRNFYIRRTLRIFPLYYAVIAIYILTMLLIGGNDPAAILFFENLGYFLTYTSNIFVEQRSDIAVVFYISWSLAAEEQFYLAWPPVLKFIGQRYALILMIVLTSATVLVQSNFGPEYGLGFAYLQYVQLPICLGVLAALLAARERSFVVFWRFFGPRISAPVTLALLLFSLGASAPVIVSYILMAALVIACAINEHNGLSACLKNRWISHVGKVSYGMYLFHMLVLTGLRRSIPGDENVVLLTVAAVALTTSIATLSYRWFELYFLKMKNQYRALPSPRAN